MHSPTGALLRYDLWNIHGELNKFALPTEVRKNNAENSDFNSMGECGGARLVDGTFTGVCLYI